MTGHLLGGAGGLEAGITVLALRDQILPPTINYETPDPECDLDYVPNHPRKTTFDYALSNSFGFGGTNGSLVFKRWSEIALALKPWEYGRPRRTSPAQQAAFTSRTQSRLTGNVSAMPYADCVVLQEQAK